MEVSAANLNALFTSFDVIFQRGFEEPPSYYAKISSVIRSASAQTQYPWMGRTHRSSASGWATGPYRTSKPTTTPSRTGTFEDTVGISNAIEDDTFGVYEPVIEQLGWDTKVHPTPDLRDHHERREQRRHAVRGGCGGGLRRRDLLQPHRPSGRLKNQGAGQVSTPNCDNTGSGSFWYIIDASRRIKPFIFQMRRDYVVSRMNAVSDEHVFTKREFRFGVDARANSGVGLWQLAFASNQDLTNPVNYGNARAAMRKIKTDAGLPFGALSSGKGILPAGAAIARRGCAATASLGIHGRRRDDPLCLPRTSGKAARI